MVLPAKIEHFFTLWGNLGIVLFALAAIGYFTHRIGRKHVYREPLAAIILVFLAVVLRIGPWAYAQVQSATCGPGDYHIVCFYDLFVFSARPYFTFASMLLLMAGGLKFARWVDRQTIQWEGKWFFGFFVVSLWLAFLL